MHRNTFCQTLRIGDEKIIADELYFAANAFGHLLPTGPIFFRQTIFDRNDGIFSNPRFPHINHFIGSFELICFPEVITLFADFLRFFVELRRRGIHGNHEVSSRSKSGRFNCFYEILQGFFIVLEVRRKTTFIPHCCRMTILRQDALKRMEHFGALLQRFRPRTSTYRHNHKFLEIDGIVRMFSAVNNIHHGNRQSLGIYTANVIVQRHTVLIRRSTSASKRNT